MTENAVLTKSELVEEVAAARHLLNKDAEFVVNAVFDSIVSSLEPGCSEIQIRGFGISGFAIELRKSDVFRRATAAREQGLRAVEADC